jgi:hypothetical protein
MTIANVSADKLTLTLTTNLMYTHLSFLQETTTTTQTSPIRIAAAVGLLTRNVKVIGTEYPQQNVDLYGFSILVSTYSRYDSLADMVFAYEGYVRLSNVEFVHPGQFYRSTSTDSRYGIVLADLGAYDTTRPTYVTSCSFHHGYSIAIGIFGSSSIPIESNVFYRTLDAAIYLALDTDSTIIRRNLLTMNYWGSVFVPDEAKLDSTFMGSITANAAQSAVIEYNFIAGAQRTGLLYKGDVCAGQSIGSGSGSGSSSRNHSIKFNTFHSCIIGLAIFPDDSFSQLTCISISHSLIFKSVFYGVYYQNPYTLNVDSITFVDNQVGMVAFVLGPASLAHLTSNKKVQITNSVFVGRSNAFNCSMDVMPLDFNFNNTKTMQPAEAGGKKT